MKKKIMMLILSVLLAMGVMSGCGKEEVEAESVVPEEKIKEICQLVTHDYILSMVAKDVKLPEKGWITVLDQNRDVWLQYEGKVSVGVELPENFIKKSGKKFQIREPHPVVLTTDIVEESFTKDSYYIAGEKWYSSNEITAEFQKGLVAQAQKELRESVEQDPALMTLAKDRAKELIEEYIEELGNVAGKDYEVEWIEEKVIENPQK